MENPAIESFLGLFSRVSSPDATLVDLLTAAILLIRRDRETCGDLEPITESKRCKLHHFDIHLHILNG